VTVDTAGNPIDPDVPPPLGTFLDMRGEIRAAQAVAAKDAADIERLTAWLTTNGHTVNLLDADGSAVDAAIGLLAAWGPRIAADQYKPPAIG